MRGWSSKLINKTGQLAKMMWNLHSKLESSNISTNSVVTKKNPANVLAGGVPVKIRRET